MHEVPELCGNIFRCAETLWEQILDPRLCLHVFLSFSPSRPPELSSLASSSTPGSRTTSGSSTSFLQPSQGSSQLSPSSSSSTWTRALVSPYVVSRGKNEPLNEAARASRGRVSARQNALPLSLSSFVTGLPHLRHGEQRHQEQSVQRRDPGHPQRGAQPQPRRRRRSVSRHSPLPTAQCYQGCTTAVSDQPSVTPSADEGESFNPLKVDVFLQTLLHLAAKSFSHSFSALAK